MDPVTATALCALLYAIGSLWDFLLDMTELADVLEEDRP